MLQFEWPWLLILLPLPLLVRQILPAVNQSQAALHVPFLDDFNQSDSPLSLRHTSNKFWLLLAILAWIALIAAISRPQWLGDAVELPVEGRDLMLAVDLSGSMKEQDFRLNGRRVNRLVATKAVAGAFIEKRAGDRIGLILFGERAYLQAPLTFDRKTVRILLNEALINIAGPKTAIGDAIGLAVKRLRENTGDKVLILLSDGENTAGVIDPMKAAELAANEGLKIYTIGIGSTSGDSSFFGMQRGGRSSLDETSLRKIAERTGGLYFRAKDTRTLAQIYAQIDKLEPVASEDRVYRPVQALYFWPLGIALLLTTLLLIQLAHSRWRN